MIEILDPLDPSMLRKDWLIGKQHKEIHFCDGCGSSSLCHCMIFGVGKSGKLLDIEESNDVQFFSDSIMTTGGRGIVPLN